MRWKYRALIASLLVALFIAALTGFAAGTPKEAQAASPIAGLHIVGNKIENSGGQVFRPLGVDRGGTEYECDSAGTTAVFDGPNDLASVQALQSWDVNTVRLPLNEDCWLGINGFPAGTYSAAQYQQTIVSYVNLLNANNIAVILDLHWAAPGTQQPKSQTPMPDLDHTGAFWTSVANTFKSNSSVIFDLFNEPYTQSWSCWLNGSTAANQAPCGDVGFAVAGMQTMVNAVRATGATNVLMAGGLAYSNDLSQWLQNEPNDPLHSLAASFHLYNFNACSSASCWSSTIAPVAAKVPVVTGEMGENDCSSGFINTAMSWLDQNGVGYLGWGWDTYDCSSYPSLISNYNGTPTAFGAGLKAHLIALAGGSNPTPTPTQPGPTPTPPNPTPTSTQPASGGVHVGYQVSNQWQGGFSANVSIKNNGSSTINSWNLQFTFPGDQKITQLWNGNYTQSGEQVSITNMSYNGTIAPGQTVTFGFNGTWTSSDASPTSFTLNGAPTN
ncbi:Glyco_hydro_1 and CBM_2 domain-containing protein [Ktedonobacteria bacterium brp13]|nr:Glyco_hydro_1 and CBM_2 domain-containing protein [Ktedonobacteria bacterium brp13]